jgi:hypothetical protein
MSAHIPATPRTPHPFPRARFPLIFNRAPALPRHSACVFRVPRPKPRLPEKVGTPLRPPPPMATQLQNLRGASAIVVGAFCEHNDQVHSLVDLLAAKTGPGAETETCLDNKSAVAFEKHRIRLRMATGAWRDYHESIHAFRYLSVCAGEVHTCPFVNCRCVKH